MNKSLKVLLVVVLAIAILNVGMSSPIKFTKAEQTSGIVTIAFDDGIDTQFENAFPVMQEHGFNGTFYIITSLIGTDGYMNMSDLHALQGNGSEIGSHTVDHQEMTSLTDEQVNYEFNASQQCLQANGFSATDFAYPYGGSNPHVDSIGLQYYRSLRYAYGSGYFMPLPPSPSQMSLPMGFPGETGDSEALPQDEYLVQNAYDTNSWVIIFFHSVVTTPVTDADEIGQSDFAALLNYIGNTSVQVLTVNQTLNLFSASQKVTVLPSISPGAVYPYSSVTTDLSQDIMFNASASGGLSPYNYTWYLNQEKVGTNQSSYDFNPDAAGEYSLYANATDSAAIPKTVTSNPVSIIVNDDLYAPSIAASAYTLDQNQASTLSSSPVTTGTSPYTYQWLEMPPGGSSYSPIDGATDSTYYFSTSASTETGTWQFELQISDLFSEQVTTNSLSVVVMTPPTVSLSPTYWSMDIGQSKTFKATASGGSGTYSSYQWFVDGSLQTGQGSSTFRYSPATLGSHTITASVTDNLGVNSEFSTSVSVCASPTVSVQPAGPINLDVGQVQTFTAVPNSGTGSLSYQWYLDGGAVGSNCASYTFTVENGTHQVSCIVTDSASVPIKSLASNNVSITENPILSVSVLPNTWILDSGQEKEFTASPNGGSGIYSSYQWYLNNVLQNGQNAPSFTIAPSAMGSYSITVTVTDSMGCVSSQSCAAILTVNAPPTVSITPAGPFTLDAGQTQLFTANYSGGFPSVSYQWYVDGNKAGSNTANYTYSSTIGSHSITCTVTDNASIPYTSSASNAVIVNANPLLVAPTVFASSNTINQAETCNLTASSQLTGTNPFEYKWFQWAPDGNLSYVDSNSANLSFATTSDTACGVWSFILQVKDSAGAEVNSSEISLTVNPIPEPTASPTPSPTSPAANPTPSPTSSATDPVPTSTAASPSPTQTSTSSANPTDSPANLPSLKVFSVPEFTTIIAVIALVAGATSLILCAKAKKFKR